MQYCNGVERVIELKVLGVVLNSRLSFDSHNKSMAISAFTNLGIMRKALYRFDDPVLVLRCF